MRNALLKNTIYLKSCATLQTTLQANSLILSGLNFPSMAQISHVINKISWIKKSFELFFAFAPNFSKIQNKFDF